MSEIQKPPPKRPNLTTSREEDVSIIRDARKLLLVTLAAIGIGVSVSPFISRDDRARTKTPHRTLAELDKIARDEAAMPKVTPLVVGDLDTGIFNVRQAASGVVDGGVDSQKH